ncbi:unnamed protein product, partial [Heterosigma akashiwo]
MDADTNKLKGFGFATFSTPEAANKACEVLNGFKVEGQPMLVKVGKKEQAIIDEMKAQWKK